MWADHVGCPNEPHIFRSLMAESKIEQRTFDGRFLINVRLALLSRWIGFMALNR